MAGVAGVVGNREIGLTEQMLGVIEHRGPDKLRVHRAEGLCVGVRASDLSEARGDGFASDGEVAVLFDGEIYNDRPMLR